MSGRIMAEEKLLVYLVRKDLRTTDNPILHYLATTDHGFTHLLPVFVFHAGQMEISGLIDSNTENKSPYPEARSIFGGYWRCGPYRAKFIAQTAWNLKKSLESLNSGLILRAGMHKDVTETLLDGLKSRGHKASALWMTSDEGIEEQADERAVSAVCEERGVAFKLWQDEKYFIDDRDVSFQDPNELPDIFTTYQKSAEPLRGKPRSALPKPPVGSIPPFPGKTAIPEQASPFVIPETYDELEAALLRPVKDFFPDILPCSETAINTHPFTGGEDQALERLEHVMKSGLLASYNNSRNGLVGLDFSTKLSAFLAQGCITARQIHAFLVEFEEGTNAEYEHIEGYGKGESEHTKSVRVELMWRDYMRLYARKYNEKMFHIDGVKGSEAYRTISTASGQAAASSSNTGVARMNTSAPVTRVFWKTADWATASAYQTPPPGVIRDMLERYKAGTTGLGLIDASQRELLHTGYTSNRARQNSANFLAKHLGIDWRYGAEWYEMLLVDYDVCSNWANWQYVAGVGNDPRGEARIFNPVKQAFDYDKDGSYVRMWVPELAGLKKLENLFQASTASQEDLETTGLTQNPMVTNPVKRIKFNPDGSPRSRRRRPQFSLPSFGRGAAPGFGGGRGSNAQSGKTVRNGSGGRGSAWTTKTARGTPQSQQQYRHDQQQYHLQQMQHAAMGPPLGVSPQGSGPGRGYSRPEQRQTYTYRGPHGRGGYRGVDTSYQIYGLSMRRPPPQPHRHPSQQQGDQQQGQHAEPAQELVQESHQHSQGDDPEGASR